MYSDVFKTINQGELLHWTENSTAADVQRALGKEKLDVRDFIALISPAADEFLPKIAEKARQLTIQRFGRTILMYAPLYISNYCTNACVYCGFNHGNEIGRLCLTPEEVEKDAEIIASEGFRHLLLVSGEDEQYCDTPYIASIAKRLKPKFSSIGVEVQPLSTEGYATLVENGVDALTIYQETYEQNLYKQVHPGGKKSRFAWRLDTPDRGAQAGMRKIGIGVLLGLGNFRLDAANVALHAQYLMKHYWRTQVSVSFPRLRAAAGGYQPNDPVSDKDLFKIICAFRLFTVDAVLVLSTRESAQFRDLVFPYGVTQMSAGSRTNPGGYTNAESEAEVQFHIEDDRTPAMVAQTLATHGYEAVWKDWDRLLA